MSVPREEAAMHIEIAEGWQLKIDEGPEWLFLRLSRTHEDGHPEPPVAQQGWTLAEERGKLRLVFELHENARLTSFLVGQLLLLHKRAELAGGTFRIQGFSEQNYEALRMTRVAESFPNYASREDAVLGRQP